MAADVGRAPAELHEVDVGAGQVEQRLQRGDRQAPVDHVGDPPRARLGGALGQGQEVGQRQLPVVPHRLPPGHTRQRHHGSQGTGLPSVRGPGAGPVPPAAGTATAGIPPLSLRALLPPSGVRAGLRILGRGDPRGSLCLVVRQCMSSVLGMLKETRRSRALRLMARKADWSNRMLVR